MGTVGKQPKTIDQVDYVVFIKCPVTGLRVSIPGDIAEAHQMPAGTECTQQEFNTLLVALFERWLDLSSPEITIEHCRQLLNHIHRKCDDVLTTAINL